MKILRFLSLFFVSFTFFVACGSQVRSGSDSLGLKVIPADSSLVASVNINTLLNDPLFKDLVKKDSKFKMGSEELKKIGIDINTDIKNVYFGSTEALFQEGSKGTADFVALIEANYDEAKLLDFIKKKNKQKFTEKKIKGFTVMSSNDSQVNAEFALYKNKAIIISRKDKIAKYLDLLEGNGESITDNKEMSQHFALVSQSNLIWGISQIKGKLDELRKKNLKKAGGFFTNLTNEMNKVDFISFGLDKKENLSLILNQTSPDEKSAKTLSTELNNAISFAKGLAKDFLSPESLNSIKVKQEGDNTSLSLSILKQDLEKLKQTAGVPKQPSLQ